ncbi:MAG: hypothetical protein EOP84_04765, partial [Verrucomicrobiaceae bacterium]
INSYSIVRCLLFVLGIVIFFCSCRESEKKNKEKISKDSLKKQAIREWNKTIPGSFNATKELFFDSLQIVEFISSYPDLKPYTNSIQKFYNDRNLAFAWYNKSGLIEQAGNLADRVKNLKDEGVNQDIPYRIAFDSLLYAKSTKKPDINLELMLTAQYFVFAKLAWQGLDNNISKSEEWYLPRKKISYEQYLDSLVKTPAKNSSSLNAPVYRQYGLLKNFLIEYRKLEETDAWKAIVANQKSYRVGDSSLIIQQIKTRLFKLGDYKADTIGQSYDTLLLTAVKQFQKRHGMLADGVIGQSSLIELNVPLKKRIKQILVNMERCRWLPVRVNSSYLAVNIPEFKLHVYDSDSLLWSGNVVVGQSVHKTVIFSGDIKYVVFSPYWNLPTSIVKNEVMPAMRRNSGYIKSHQMEITGYSGGIPNIRQKPGPKNSLGQVKFLFPSKRVVESPSSFAIIGTPSAANGADRSLSGNLLSPIPGGHFQGKPPLTSPVVSGWSAAGRSALQRALGLPRQSPRPWITGQPRSPSGAGNGAARRD